MRLPTLPWLTSRKLLLAVFLLCAGLIAFALYLQEHDQLEPCPLCIIQRYGFVVVGVLALIAAVLPRFLMRGVASLAGLLALAGAGVGGWHLWLQLHPPAVSACGASLEYMVANLPLGRALPRIFQGFGDCTDVQWTLLGLSIPGWSMIAFVGVAVLLFWAQAKKR
jgi:protein dithiol:quinone oxidoreductase